MAEPPVPFAGALRNLRAGAGLTQEELAEVAGLSSRAISDLERGAVTTPHRESPGSPRMKITAPFSYTRRSPSAAIRARVACGRPRNRLSRSTTVLAVMGKS